MSCPSREHVALRLPSLVLPGSTSGTDGTDGQGQGHAVQCTLPGPVLVALIERITNHDQGGVSFITACIHTYDRLDAYTTLD
jgi:hypothetical protein